ncbi:hypothetical protein PISMIDRAFT_25078 [Pisolithus microcarpus 441]|uniref:Uncharacterized protein n=1 Tax=Pisolithus microcarpus 441 TaxID=765257 RepID=A0A0C9YRY8_9AGAM|nr:hypothetical protein PISMIDRAFT_25078 [Pisolithus microcarpus 441]
MPLTDLVWRIFRTDAVVSQPNAVIQEKTSKKGQAMQLTYYCCLSMNCHFLYQRDPRYKHVFALISLSTTGQRIARDRVTTMIIGARGMDLIPTPLELTAASATDMRPLLPTLPQQGQTGIRKTLWWMYFLSVLNWLRGASGIGNREITMSKAVLDSHKHQGNYGP